MMERVAKLYLLLIQTLLLLKITATSINLTIKASPDHSSDDGYFLIGTNVTIRCEASDLYSSGSLFLTKQDTILAARNLTDDGMMAFTAVVEHDIKDLQEDDTGTYICIAVLVSGESHNVSLEVLIIVSPNENVKTSPENFIAMFGDNVTFDCKTDVQQSINLWMHNVKDLVCIQSDCSNGIFTFNATYEEILNATVGDSQILMVNTITASVGGEYACLVYNDAGIGLAASYIFVTPYITSEPMDIEIDYFDEASLSCKAESFPDPLILWQKLSDGDQFIDLNGENKTKLLFENAVISNSGLYRCIASITINDVEYISYSRNATITVIAISNVSISGPLFIEQRQEVSYYCAAQGAPSNIHEWMINGMVIEENDLYNITNTFTVSSTSSQLTIFSVDAAANKGIFTCKVSNVAGGSKQSSLVVTVSPENEVITSPLIISALRGDNITFTCHTEAGPNTTYLWLYNIIEIVCIQSDCSSGIFAFNASSQDISNRTLTDSKNLSLTNVNALDNGGEYTCVSLNDAGIGTSTSMLNFPPQIFEEPLDIIVTNLNDSVSLNCRAEAFPFPHYQWQKRISGRFVDLQGEVSERFFEKDIEHSHAGAYRCVVTNTINDTVNAVTSRIVIIHITPRGSAVLSVETTGQYIDGNLYVKQGGKFYMTCAASGGPNNTHIWRLNGIMLFGNDDGLDISSTINDTASESILHVNNINAAIHQGSYVCEIINEAGNDTARINVHVSPENILFTSPATVYASRGDNVIFTCHTSAGPNTTYLWLYNIIEIVCIQSDCSNGIIAFNASSQDVSNRTLADSKNLSLTNVNALDNGGEYTCVALNDAGVGTSTSMLNFPPQILEEPLDIIVTNLNDSVSLNCRAEAFPFPRYQWQKRISGRFVDLQGEVYERFFEKDTEHSHAGAYRCVVTNTINDTVNAVTSKIAIIHITPRGSAVLSVETTGQYIDGNLYVKQGSKFDMTCAASGGPNNTHIWRLNGIILFSNDDGFDVSSTINDTASESILHVNNINAAIHQGSYVCEVINEAGNDTVRVNVLASPENIVFINPITVNISRGNNVTFTCHTDAGPNTTYLWLYNIIEIVCIQSDCSSGIFAFNTSSEDLCNSFVGTKEGLNISSVSAPLHGGEYTCIVLNDAGIGMETSVLNVATEFVTHPESINTTAGSSFRLTCIAEGYPYPITQWQKMSRTSGEFEDIPGERGTVLVFNDTEHADFGMYRCMAFNEIDEQMFSSDISNSAIVTISPEGSIVIAPKNMIFLYSSQAVLKCTIDGGPGNQFEWYFNDTLVVSGMNNIVTSNTLYESTLNISSVRAPIHGGNYKCLVINAAGFDEAYTVLFVAPQIVEHPQLTLANNGSFVALVCKGEAFPLPKYSWFLSDIEIAGQTNARLEFQPIKFGDEGIYVCRVTSNMLMDISARTNVFISPAGSVSIMPTVINGKVGGNYTANCTAKGGLNNQFQWTYSRTGSTVSSNALLNLKNASVLDGGFYKCSVSNLAGNDNKTFTLNFAPNILEGPVSINVSVRIQDIRLNCTVNGFPVPFVIWTHNGNIVNGSSRIVITSYLLKEMTHQNDDFGILVSQLVILSADINDTGLYQCEGVTTVAEYLPVNSNEATVLVQDVPEPPHSLDNDGVYSRNITLLWAIPHDNNAPILGYFIFFSNPFFISGGNQVIIRLDETIGQVRVEGLHPGEYYSFTIIAFNKEGNSSLSEVYRVQTLDEKPSGAPQSVNAQPLSATSVLIKWDAPAIENRHGQIVSYDVMFAARDTYGRVTEMKWKQVFGNLSTNLKRLNEYTKYSLSVRAATSAGPGPLFRPFLVVRTYQSYPGPMSPPRYLTIGTTYAVLTWSPPQQPNGVIISYNIEIELLGFNESPFLSSSLGKEGALACYQYLNLAYSSKLVAYGEELNTTLIPFTNYRVWISASTINGSGNYSNYTYFSTPEDDRGAIVDLTGTTHDVTSVVLSWNAPPCPNGLISGYYIFYRRANYTQSKPITSSLEYDSLLIRSRNVSVSFVIDGLIHAQNYTFHVRAFDNQWIPGRADSEILVKIDSQISLTNTDLQFVLSPISASSQNLVIVLPSSTELTTIGITNIEYYGVIVVPNPDEEFLFEEDNFDATYPNLQPYENRGRNRYYIAVGWNNAQFVPDNFRVGDNSRTTATRNGVEENYLNSQLKPLTTYCFYILITYVSNVGNEVVVRYVELSCQKTERGYSIAALEVGSITAFLVLVVLLILLIILILHCYRRRKNSNITFEQSDLVIQNPTFKKEKVTIGDGIAISEFPAYVKSMHSNNDRKFSEEFSVIEPLHTSTTIVAAANRGKNRYQNYITYDHSRVVLTDSSGDSVYINASFIEGYKGSNDFIATQDPSENTAADFWSMIWDYDIPVIVMLTELKNRKCYKYWPDTVNEVKKSGSIEVKLIEEVDKDFYDFRSLLISKNGKLNDSRIIWQFHFKAWCGYQVPKHPDELLSFIMSVKARYRTIQQNHVPTVVHCSTGVGKTGVFIALSVQLDRAEKEQTIDIYNYVQYMRKQRPSMILNEAEYIFLYDILCEAIDNGMIDTLKERQTAAEDRYIVQLNTEL